MEEKGTIAARIGNELNAIERQENIKILHCVESGSRAWGFASPDSDYDVRFIYVRPKEFYLRLDRTRDVIEWRLDETLDINGWDIQKALRLLYNSNPTLFEWNASPVVYRTSAEWEKVASVIDRYFVQKSGLYHYLHTAQDNYREYLKGPRVRLKKYFYVLRPLLACKWILDRGTPPPMPFETLQKAYPDDEIRPYVERLLALKMNAPELGEGDRMDAVNAYIERTLAETKRAVAALPDEREHDWKELNELFLSLL